MAKKKIMSNKDSAFRSFLMSALRRLSRFWAPINEKKKQALVFRGNYRCEICSKVVNTKDIKVDHINPVVPIEGMDSWDQVINNLFCEIENLQAICNSCHDMKTTDEINKRKDFRKQKRMLEYSKKRNSSDDPFS